VALPEQSKKVKKCITMALQEEMKLIFKIPFKMQRVLVTGGTGFLGSHITQQLLSKGF
jgi:FlaA1/EpsC-like NDP-sugar epimerase